MRSVKSLLVISIAVIAISMGVVCHKSARVGGPPMPPCNPTLETCPNQPIR